MHTRFGRLRMLNRFRWLKKLNMVRASYSRVDSSPSLLKLAMYVALDPEIHTFSYDFVLSPDDKANISRLLPVSVDDVEAYCHEFDFVRHNAIHPLMTIAHPESKLRPPMGRHLLAYVLVRARKPQRVLELGVHHGLGSVAILAALQKNRSEGKFGVLESVDVNRANGWLAQRSSSVLLKHHTGLSTEVLPRIDPLPPVGLAIFDTTWEEETTHRELALVRQRAESDLVILHNAEWNSVVRTEAVEAGGRFIQVHEVPLNHWSSGRVVDLCLFP